MVGPHLTPESASMNASQLNPQQAPNVSGAIRYERVAILEAALNIKERRQREFWMKAVAAVAIIALVTAGFALAVA